MKEQLTDAELMAGWATGEKYQYPCPVCGLEWRWTEPLAKISYSYDICPRCDIEFGYEDTVSSHEELRAEWDAQGKPWHSTVISPEQYERCMTLVTKPCKPCVKPLFVR